jgi:hypothetical protein
MRVKWVVSAGGRAVGVGACTCHVEPAWNAWRLMEDSWVQHSTTSIHFSAYSNIHSRNVCVPTAAYSALKEQGVGHTGTHLAGISITRNCTRLLWRSIAHHLSSCMPNAHRCLAHTHRTFDLGLFFGDVIG